MALSSFFEESVFAVQNSDERIGQFSAGAQRTGFYAAIGTGKFFFSGLDRQQYSDGWIVAFKAGYDFIKYMGLELQFKMTAHESNVRTVNANVNPTFFGYQYNGLVKGAYPITKRLYVGGGIGGGVWQTDPNFQPNRGSSSRGLFVAELNLEYFLRNKGLSIGMDPSVGGIANIQSAVYQFSGYIRHTF